MLLLGRDVTLVLVEEPELDEGAEFEGVREQKGEQSGSAHDSTGNEGRVGL